MKTATHKKCCGCDRRLPIEDFWRNRSTRDGRYDYCRACASEYKRMYRKGRRWSDEPRRCPGCRETKPGSEWWRKADYCKTCMAQRNRRAKILRVYGISIEQYDEMHRAQSGRCAICLTTKPGGFGGKHLHIDHDHETGRVRGLLCSNCNSAIGKLKDDPGLLAAARDYLLQHKKEVQA